MKQGDDDRTGELPLDEFESHESLVLVAHRLIAELQRLEECKERDTIPAIAKAITDAHAELQRGIAAHLEVGRPSLEQLEWRVKVAGDRFDRASETLRRAEDYLERWGWHFELVLGESSEDDDEELAQLAELGRQSEAAGEALEKAYRARRAHPDYVPKKKRRKKQ